MKWRSFLGLLFLVIHTCVVTRRSTARFYVNHARLSTDDDVTQSDAFWSITDTFIDEEAHYPQISTAPFSSPFTEYSLFSSTLT